MNLFTKAKHEEKTKISLHVKKENNTSMHFMALTKKKGSMGIYKYAGYFNIILQNFS